MRRPSKRQPAIVPRSAWDVAGQLVAHVASHVGVAEVLRRRRPVAQRGTEAVPIMGAVEIERRLEQPARLSPPLLGGSPETPFFAIFCHFWPFLGIFGPKRVGRQTTWLS